MTETKAGDVARKVRDRLRDVRPAGLTLELLEEGIRQIDDWWRVPVRPSAEPIRLFEYYEAIAELESELQENERINVVFATAESNGASLPGEAPA